ncbi:MAG: DMT family transporter [Gemmatimonadota bacterium]
MVAAAFFFSVMSLLVKVAGQRLPSQELVLGRSVIMLGLAAAMVKYRGLSFLGKRPGLLLLRGLLGFAALSCYYYAVVHLPLADATTIQYTNPAFTAVLAALLLGEHIRAREALLVGTSLVGVLLMAHPSFVFGANGSRLPLGAVVVALGGAVFSAGAYVAVRELRHSDDPYVIIFYFALVSALGSLLPTALTAVAPTSREWLLLLGIGGSTHLGQLLLTRGLALEQAGRAMTISYVQIVFAALWGALCFGYVPDVWALGGAALVVGGTVALGRGARGAP